ARRTGARRPNKLGDVRPLPKKPLHWQWHGRKNRRSGVKSASGSFGFGGERTLEKWGVTD
ncbi:hypothetical protein, partial [Photorhabdus bodei]|uniref:hypothetical protein n=1 Tax=Photorhabdus bodei TaxID=2029681 RepID=UPI00142E1D2A